VSSSYTEFTVFIRLEASEARLQPNPGFTFERALTVFTCSGITPPKVDRFWWNLEHSECILGGRGVALVDFGRDPRCNESWRARLNFFPVRLATHNFTDFPWAKFHRFPVGQISRHLNTPRRSVSQWILAVGTEFGKFSRNGSLFSTKPQKCDFLQRLAASNRHNSAIFIDRRNFITKSSLYGKSSFHFYRWNQLKIIPLACILRTRNIPKFSAASEAGWRHCYTGRQWRSTIESRNTRLRRMHEVDS